MFIEFPRGFPPTLAVATTELSDVRTTEITSSETFDTYMYSPDGNAQMPVGGEFISTVFTTELSEVRITEMLLE